MRINGAALNRAALNHGAARLPVYFDAAARLMRGGALEGRLIRCGAARFVNAWQAAARGAAQRFAVAAPDPLQTYPVGAFSALRAGAGGAPIRTGASLYYTRAVPLAGGLEVVFSARGDVGVVFGEGEGRFEPVTVLEGARCRNSQGRAVLKRGGDFSASAIRHALTGRGETDAAALPLTAALDSAHVRDGVRTVDGSGGLLVSFALQDAGLQRQCLIGSAQLRLLGHGTGRVIRRPHTRDGYMALTTQAAFRVARRAELIGALVPASVLAGEIFVRGEGTLTTRWGAQATGTVWRRNIEGRAVMHADAGLVGVRRRTGKGAAALIWTWVGEGARGRVMDGVGVIETIGIQEAILNPFAIDDEDQHFSRLGGIRSFSRSAQVRQWLRP